jgi:hypothetical protein
MSENVDHQFAEHKKSIEEFIQELDREHLKWYERQQNTHYRLWIALEVISVAAPLLTTIFSGIASALNLFSFGWVKCVMTVLPALAVAASSMLARLGVREMESSRELGRLEFEVLLRNAKIELQCASESEQVLELHRKLVAEAARIDTQQHHAHHRVTSSSRRKAEAE